MNVDLPVYSLPITPMIKHLFCGSPVILNSAFLERRA